MKHYDDETVGAYVDGELDSHEVREFQATLTGDPDLQRRVAEVRRMDTALRAWSSRRSQQAALATPPLLAAAVEPRPPRHRRFPGALQWSQALAAGVALMFGIGIGQFVKFTPSTDGRQEQSMYRLLQTTLEHTQSGQSVTWNDADAEQTIVVEPLRTYHANNTFCREYRELIGSPQQDAKVIYGLACREPDGPWNVEYTLMRGPQPTHIRR